MTEKDSRYLTHKHSAPPESRDAVRAIEVVTNIPNIDGRHGDGKAEVLGIAVLDSDGRPIHLIEPATSIIVRISVRAKADLAEPNVGFMMRNQNGVDFAGTNTIREDYELPSMQEGDVYTVDFHLQLPELYGGSFSFSPAIADGPLDGYRIADWIENAISVQMSRSDRQIYGYLHLPCRVEVNARIGQNNAETTIA
jgi:hypothetical protein